MLDDFVFVDGGKHYRLAIPSLYVSVDAVQAAIDQHGYALIPSGVSSVENAVQCVQDQYPGHVALLEVVGG